MIKSYNYKDFKIEILYEDSYIAILNKPTGLLTHKKNGLDNSPNLQESLKDQFTINDNEYLKEGIVHRLDKDTSGVIVITKNNNKTIIMNNNIDLNNVYLINENQYQQKLVKDDKAFFQIVDIETNKVLKEIVIEKD